MTGRASTQPTHLNSGVPGAGAGRFSRWRWMSSSTRRHAVPLLPPYTDGVRGRVLTSSDICTFTAVSPRWPCRCLSRTWCEHAQRGVECTTNECQERASKRRARGVRRAMRAAQQMPHAATCC